MSPRELLCSVSTYIGYLARFKKIWFSSLALAFDCVSAVLEYYFHWCEKIDPAVDFRSLIRNYVVKLVLHWQNVFLKFRWQVEKFVWWLPAAWNGELKQSFIRLRPLFLLCLWREDIECSITSHERSISVHEAACVTVWSSRQLAP